MNIFSVLVSLTKRTMLTTNRTKAFCHILLLAWMAASPALSFSQGDNSHLRVSLLTCAPGDALYSTFGHTGIRVIDSASQIDAVFNYGMFDDSDPYFYVKFTRGFMRYSVAAMTFGDFMEEYVSEHRGVTEQVLRLDDQTKTRLFQLLKENLGPRERFYNYQFCYDNCTTRARIIIDKSTGGAIQWSNVLPPGRSTFRDLIHQYLDSARLDWDEFGVDLLLGSHLDTLLDNERAMFLPDYLMKGFDVATLQGSGMVATKKWLLPPGPPATAPFFWTRPLFLFSLFAIIFIVLSFINRPWAEKWLKILDGLFFLLLGCMGLLIAALWAVRVDAVCRNNLNLAWAWPTHAAAVFFLKTGRSWVRYYFLAAAGVSALLLAGWIWWPQQFNLAFMPIMVTVVMRGFHIYRKKKNHAGSKLV